MEGGVCCPDKEEQQAEGLKMQRKYLAVAILCTGASVGHAQSTVTLYGVVDADRKSVV